MEKQKRNDYRVNNKHPAHKWLYRYLFTTKYLNQKKKIGQINKLQITEQNKDSSVEISGSKKLTELHHDI